MANEPLKLVTSRCYGNHGTVAEMFMANEPLKHHNIGFSSALTRRVAEMFMANEPLKHSRYALPNTDNAVVAEMFMANEPLKPIIRRGRQDPGRLQRCLWRMSH